MRVSHHRPAAVLLAAALSAPLPAAAEQHEVEQNAVIVTATRIATPESRIGSSVSVVTAQDIARKQYKSVAAALRSLPGVDVVQAGGPGQLTSVFIRGASSSHTLVLIDGINITDPSHPTGAVDFSGLLLDNVERIEVVRGPQSSLYGANAIGGVVNIITRRGKGDPSVTLSMQAGNHASRYQQLSLLGAQQRFDYAFSGTHLKTHSSSVTPTELRDNVPAEADRYRNTTLSARLGLQLAPTLDVSFSGRYIDDTSELDPEVGFGTVEDADAQLHNRQYFVRGETHAVLLDGRWDATLAASYVDYNRRNENQRTDPLQTLQQTRFQGDTLEFSIDNDFYLNQAHTLTFGGGTKRERMNNDGFSDFGGFIVSELSSASARTNFAWLQDQFAFGEQLFGTAGLRLDDRDDFGSEVTWRFTGVYLYPRTGTRFNASIGTAFRAPSLFELYGFTPNNFGAAYRGNPDLEPEKSFGWEVGAEQSVLADRLELGITWFHNDVDNLIETVFDPAFNSTSANINNVRLRGVEAYLDLRPLAKLSTRLDYTFTDADVSDNSDRPLLRRPRHKASMNIVYAHTARTGVDLGADYIGKRKDIDRVSGAVIDADEYTVFNAGITYALNPQFRLEARIDNLLDTRYEPADGFEALGRSYMLGFTGSL